MKKLICTLLALAMCASMAACGGEPAETTNSSNEQTAATTTTKADTTTNASTTTDAPATTQAPVTTATKAPVTTKAPETTTTKASVTTKAPVTEPTPAECSHNYKVGATKDATCTAKGSKTYTCSKCGVSYLEEIAMIAHNYAAATCTEPKTCKVCGTASGSAVGHKYTEATCTAPKTCKVCGATEGDVAAHKYSGGTCTTAATCSVCGQSEGTAKGHTFDGDSCSVCGTPKPSEEPEIEQKSILAIGDSICAGVRNGRKGFVGDLGLPYKNAGVSGATISNKRTAVTNIPDQLIGVTGFEPDIIISNGGVNDYFYGAELGVIPTSPVTTDKDAEDLNRDTVMGGLQYLFYKMTTLYPNAQRYFLLTHKTTAKLNGKVVDWTITANSAGYTQTELFDAIKEVCAVYDVKVIDVFGESMINTAFDEYRSDVAYADDKSVTNSEFVDSDGVHPLAYGYLYGYVPLIKQALAIETYQ